MIEEIEKKLDNEIIKANKKNSTKAIFSFLPAVFYASFGLVTTILAPISGIPALLASLGFAVTTRNILKEKQLTSARISKEKSHLNKVKNTEINSSKEMNNKRITKLNNLKESKKVKEKRKKKLKAINLIGLTALASSAILAAFSQPIVGLAASAISLATKLLTDSSISKTNSEIETLKNRINNINNDLEIIRTRRTIKVEKGKDKSKTEAKEHQEPKEKIVHQELEHSSILESEDKVIDSQTEEHVEPVEPVAEQKDEDEIELLDCSEPIRNGNILQHYVELMSEVEEPDEKEEEKPVQKVKQ